MMRRQRFDIAGNPQQVIQRGNNRAACFFAEADYVAYLHWLHEGEQHHVPVSLSGQQCYEQLGASLTERAAAYRGACTEMPDTAQLEAIRQMANHCLVLGSEQFKDQIETAMQRRARPGIGGRPRLTENVVTAGGQCGFNV